MSKYPEYRVRYYPAQTTGGVTVGSHYAVEQKIGDYWGYLRKFEHPREAAAYCEHKRQAAYRKFYGKASA